MIKLQCWCKYGVVFADYFPSLYPVVRSDGWVGWDSAEGHGGKSETAAGFPERENVCVHPRVSDGPVLLFRSKTSDFWNIFLFPFLPGCWNGSKARCPRIRFWTPRCWRPTRGWSPENVWFSSRSWNLLEMFCCQWSSSKLNHVSSWSFVSDSSFCTENCVEMKRPGLWNKRSKLYLFINKHIFTAALWCRRFCALR